MLAEGIVTGGGIWLVTWGRASPRPLYPSLPPLWWALTVCPGGWRSGSHWACLWVTQGPSRPATVTAASAQPKATGWWPRAHHSVPGGPQYFSRAESRCLRTHQPSLPLLGGVALPTAHLWGCPGPCSPTHSSSTTVFCIKCTFSSKAFQFIIFFQHSLGFLKIGCLLPYTSKEVGNRCVIIAFQ